MTEMQCSQLNLFRHREIKTAAKSRVCPTEITRGGEFEAIFPAIEAKTAAKSYVRSTETTVAPSLAPDPEPPLVAPASPPSVAPASPSKPDPVDPSMPDPVDPFVALDAPEDAVDDESDEDSKAPMEDLSRSLNVPVEDLHLPVAATTVPSALATSEGLTGVPVALPEEFTMASILQSLEKNQLTLDANTAIINGLNLNTTEYERSKGVFVRDFFESIAAHPQAAPLAEFIPDPQCPLLMTHRLYIQVCAPPSPHKLALLNYCMLIHSLSVYKVQYRNIDLSKNPKLFVEAQYKPGSIATRKDKDFNYCGGFQAEKYFSHCESYGKVANKAKKFDAKWFMKRWKAVIDPKNPLDPFNNIEHYVWCAMENNMIKWAVHGCKEPVSIVKEDFETGIIEEGVYAGIPFVQLKENYSGQKNQALSLRNPTMDKENTGKRTLPCPYSNDPLSTYQTTIKLLSMVPDNCEISNCIFCKPVSKKQIKASVLKAHVSQVIGKTKVNDHLVQIAVWSKYTDPTQCAAHGKRHETLSKVANASVCPSLIKSMDGHASIDITTRYIKPNQQAIDATVPTKHGSPSKIFAPAPAPLAPKFEIPKESPPVFSYNISFGTEEEPSPPQCKDRSQFAENCLQYKDYNHPREPRYKDCGGPYKHPCERSRLWYKHYNWYEPLYEEPPPCTQSYEPQYEERKQPPQDPCGVSFGENWSYYEPQYEEPCPPSYKEAQSEEQEHKPPPCHHLRVSPTSRDTRSSTPLLLKEALKHVLLLKTAIMSLLVKITIIAMKSRMVHGVHLLWKCFLTALVLLAGYLLLPWTQKLKVLLNCAVVVN
eukprot:jgi/Psemu1/19439/gm1.19439_g